MTVGSSQILFWNPIWRLYFKSYTKLGIKKKTIVEGRGGGARKVFDLLEII